MLILSVNSCYWAFLGEAIEGLVAMVLSSQEDIPLVQKSENILIFDVFILFYEGGFNCSDDIQDAFESCSLSY